MRKSNLMILGVLLVIAGVVALGFNYHIKDSIIITFASIKQPEREIIFQMLTDLDNDGKKESIVLDKVKGYEDPFGVYSRVLIFEILNNKKENLVFDS
ncbi:MAG: hypothetical protein GX075_11670 [Firmicutes bacterium]|nr:hypothetical protein [Bacillota bacterium]